MRQINNLEGDKEIQAIIQIDNDLNKNYRLLQSVKGVGPVVALATIIKTGNFTRFTKARKFACSENSIYLWKKKYGGMEVQDIKELRELRHENGKLKQMVANLMLEKEAIAEALKKL